MQHLMNKIGIFLIQSVKKWISKMRKLPKTANFGHVLVFLGDYYLLRPNFAPAEKLYFYHFCGYDGWEAEKSRNSGQ